MEKIRLQKYFTDCGVLSRRAAEREIEAGHVKINGVIAKLGDKVEAYVSRITDDNRIDLSLQQKGFAQVKDSAEVLYDAIVAAGGTLALTDNSSPEEIKEALGMSKKLFKRSLGVLMSHNRVNCINGAIQVKN